MKQISDVEEKPFTSSLNIGPSHHSHVKKGVGAAGGVTPPPLYHDQPYSQPNSQLVPIFHYLDDVAIISPVVFSSQAELFLDMM